MFKTVKRLYEQTGSEIIVKNAVVKGWVTKEQYISLLGAESWEAWMASLPEPDPLTAARSGKEEELSAAAHAAIVAGMDVETSAGTEHFSLEETDQINLSTALTAVQGGAAGYPYHSDGTMCRMFTAEEIQAIALAATSHKLYHTTLCNHLLTWARRAETEEELGTITYSFDILPQDLKDNMTAILAAVSGS